jgi:hydroxyacylglutathione hydrolase
VQNPALAPIDEEAFVRQQLSGLLAYPTYYASMGAINRAGARLLSEVPPPRDLSPDLVEAQVRSGALVVDARGRFDFAGAHIPGSLNVELDETFGSYVGWLVPFNDPIALVLPEPQDWALQEAWTQLVRIGYERVEGHLEGGIAAWEASGRTIRSYAVADVQDLCAAMKSGTPPKVLDVRQRTEWDAGRIAESEHIFVGDLPRRLADVPRESGEVWAICASGHRSSMAASLLDREGVPVRLVGKGGVRDFLDVCGH